jgi:hypothetical protein
MEQPRRAVRQRWSVRPTRSDLSRMVRMQARMESDNRAQVLRRALEFMDRCSQADAVWIEIDGERQRVFVP